MTWWAAHEATYPTLAALARIVLAVPGSQIECERVFSLAGLLTKNLRNRMSQECMSTSVFLTRDIDLSAKLRELLGTYYGGTMYDKEESDFQTKPPLAEAMEELESSQAVDDSLGWSHEKDLLESEEPLVPQDEYHFHSLDLSGHRM